MPRSSSNIFRQETEPRSSIRECMPDKWILTFSDKELLTADMLTRLDQPEQKCNLVAVRESQAALQQMEQRPFDLIIVADQGTATSGLSFLERVRSNYHGSHLLYQAGTN